LRYTLWKEIASITTITWEGKRKKGGNHEPAWGIIGTHTTLEKLNTRGESVKKSEQERGGFSTICTERLGKDIGRASRNKKLKELK